MDYNHPLEATLMKDYNTGQYQNHICHLRLPTWPNYPQIGQDWLHAIYQVNYNWLFQHFM